MRPFALKVFRVLHNPFFGFSAFFLAGIAVTFTPHTLEGALAYTFLAPWVVILLFILNLPLVAGAFRRFRFTTAEKRNHALEHGTIFFLTRRYGPVAGRAVETGFRLSGIRKVRDVHKAFSELLEELKSPNGSDCVVSSFCGSMIVTAQGLGVVLLSASLLLIAFTKPNDTTSVWILGGNAGAFLALRYPIGMWLQRRYFLSLDFREATIISVEQVQPEFLEHPTVLLFVETKVI